MVEEPPIFWLGNHHTESCGKPPHDHIDIRKRYEGLFENECGEHTIFVHDYGDRKAHFGWGTPGRK